MGITPCRNHPTIELLLFLTIVIKCSTASGGKRGGGNREGQKEKRNPDGGWCKENSKKKGRKINKEKIFGCKSSQQEELIRAGGKQGWGWDCCPRKWLLSHLKVTTMRSSPFLDLLSGTAEETCNATITHTSHTLPLSHTHLGTQTDWEWGGRSPTGRD